MSNENSNLRVGSAGAGLFVGSMKILGGLNNQFINNSGNPIIVVNQSGNIKRIKFDDYIFEGSSTDIEITLNPNEIAVLYSPFDDCTVYAMDAMKCSVYDALKDEDVDNPLEGVNFKEIQLSSGEEIGGLSSTYTYGFSIMIIEQ